MRNISQILFLLIMTACKGFGQIITNQNIPGNLLFSQATFKNTDSGLVIIEKKSVGCRGSYDQSFLIPDEAPVAFIPHQYNALPPQVPFLTVHGNVTYNFNYRSYLDTPFAEKDLMQHSVQTRLNMTVADKYPVIAFITSRVSNSPFFSNATDVSLQFRQSDMLENIKRKLRANADSMLYNPSLMLSPAQLYSKQIQGLIKDPGELPDIVKNAAGKYVDSKKAETEKKFKALYAEYKTKTDKLRALAAKFKNFDPAEALIKEKEKKLGSQKTAAADSLTSFFEKKTDKYTKKADSSIKNVQQQIEEQKATFEKARKEAAKAEQDLKQFQKKLTDSLQQLKKEINAITNKDGLYTYLQRKGESTKQLSTLQSALLSIKQIGIGRSWIDYSELTVKNISLSGFNIEANPGKIYLAAAAGKVNYRFRDYIVKGNYAGSGQSVALLRAGFGKKEGNNIILTYYSGKKALLNQRSPADAEAVQHISGFSVETKAAINANNFIIGEYARSVSPNIKGKIFDFKSHTNEAWSVKLFSHYGNTKITSYYRKTGEGFQSFTLYPTNSRQDAWMVRVNQGIWKNRITADAAVRKNDFNSPIALPDYSNTNIFKSFQLTARIPKYPFVSVGYYPSSQLTLSNNNVLYENRYNTLNAIVSHAYTAGKLSMNSNATYTKFYNGGSDSGFIYYNASTFTLSHSVNLRSFILEGIATVTDQSSFHQTVLEPVVTYRIKNRLSVSGSVKWLRLNHTDTKWGGTAGLNLYLKHIGTIQMHYDKIYLPGYSRNLLPVDIGRFTFSREF